MSKVLIVLLASFLLSSCAAVVIGGAGAGGYYAGKDEREFSVIVEDATITTSINSKLIVAKGVSTFDINIDTHNGIVIARGEVSSKKIRNKIINICKKTDGVKKVVSKLTIEK